MDKIYTIEIYTLRTDKTRTVQGTLKELIEYFKYTLECGHSYEHEKGNKKINLDPRTGKSLITNLNNAELNSSRYGFQGRVYKLVE